MNTPAATKTDLLLLGLLLDRPMHGYEIYQTIQSEGIDGWFSISAAGVYYSLRKLHDQGLVVESRQRRGGSASKSIYRMTGDGRTAFVDAMEAELASQEETCLDYDLPIYLLNKLPVQRALPPLERREAFLTEQAEKLRAAVAAKQARGGSPLKLAILDHKLRFLEMEKAWLADVMATIRRESNSGGEPERDHQGLMVLDGDLRSFHLPDLLYLIISGQHSGTLRVTDGAEARTLVFAEGKLECASCQRRGAPPAVTSSCEEVLAGLCEVFRWQQGRFTFDQTGEPEAGCIPLDCSVEELILRGCRKVDCWTIIQQLVPSDEIIFEVGPNLRRLEQMAPTRTEERIVAAVDGVKDVAVIARELNLTLFRGQPSILLLDGGRGVADCRRGQDTPAPGVSRDYRADVPKHPSVAFIPGRSRVRTGGQRANGSATYFPGKWKDQGSSRSPDGDRRAERDVHSIPDGAVRGSQPSLRADKCPPVIRSGTAPAGT